MVLACKSFLRASLGLTYLKLVLIGILVSGCANIVPNYSYKKQTKPTPPTKKLTPTQDIKLFTKRTEQRQLDKAIVSNSISKKDESFLKRIENKDVKFWIKYFSTRNKAGLERFITNGERYKPIIENIFKHYGLPTDLYYVGLIESGYQNRAKSHAGAVGPWQFIKATARRYGLKVTKSIDERKNIYKSTEAAALYFQDLYNIFGSWELALAAYNAGEYGIIRRIRGANTREYYELSRRKIIPKETRNYVPKVLAVMTILENPAKYNVKIRKPTQNIFIKTKAYKVKGSISLNNLAKKLKISKSIIKALNHDIQGNYIPYTGRNGFEIFLPDTSKVKLSHINNYLKSSAKNKRAKRRTASKSSIDVKSQYHTVRKNESIYSISKRYGVSNASIRKLNNISKNTIYVGQKIKLSLNSFSKVLYSYTVKKGDNLSNIASTFRIKLHKLKRMNKIAKSKIFIGQKLKVPAHKAVHYTVKKGDVLGKIAQAKNLSVSHIKTLNNISNRIFPGQKIIIDIKMI